MKALEKNQIWKLEILPPGKGTVGCRWVLTIKHNVDGSVERYKARLVAKRYLKSIPSKGLMFSKDGHMNIDGYTDAYWVGTVTDRRSTSGYFIFLGSYLLMWRSKKQKVIALSSAKAEFRGMTKEICELLWLCRLLTELGYRSMSVMNHFCDNNAAIAIAQNPI
ncbi:hypothetical protein L3X38_009798 [Prunus dulcis]|uniref:Reverse transcriptase Ty1/copia-type domain-containing protein n=1 Tax=Prunus dulcis TaxID=3755 RepID=A0AAD4WF82_PRUDU|nr:hypothetical protein L3X38_009798 [Prunus dulcis]